MNQHLERARTESSRNWKTENSDYDRTLGREQWKAEAGVSVVEQVTKRVTYYRKGKNSIY